MQNYTIIKGFRTTYYWRTTTYSFPVFSCWGNQNTSKYYQLFFGVLHPVDVCLFFRLSHFCCSITLSFVSKPLYTLEISVESRCIFTARSALSLMWMFSATLLFASWSNLSSIDGSRKLNISRIIFQKVVSTFCKQRACLFSLIIPGFGAIFNNVLFISLQSLRCGLHVESKTLIWNAELIEWSIKESQHPLCLQNVLTSFWKITLDLYYWVTTVNFVCLFFHANSHMVCALFLLRPFHRKLFVT